MSGGTENTKYYVSALVKDDGGIAHQHRLQEAGPAVQPRPGAGQRVPASGEPERHPQHFRPRALQQRQLRHQPVPGRSRSRRTSSTCCPPAEPGQPAAVRLPDQSVRARAIRSRPSTSSRTTRTSGGSWAPPRSGGRPSGRPRATSSSSASAGVDYFQQDNNFVSPPELQYEPNDGQPGTVVLSKSSNRNLNLALNATHTYTAAAIPTTGLSGPRRPGSSTRSAGCSPPRSSGARCSPGRRARSRPRARPCSRGIEPVRDLGIFGQEEVLLADRRLLLTAGLRADRSSANGNTEQVLLLSRSSRPRTGSSTRSAAWTSSSSGRRTGRPATGRSSAPSSRRHHRHDRRQLPARSSAPAPATPTIKPERQKEFEGGFDATLANGRAELYADAVPAEHHATCCSSRRWRPRSGQETRSSAPAARCGTGASRRRSRSSRCRAGT